MKRMSRFIATMLLILSMSIFPFPAISQANRLVIVDADVVIDTYTGVCWYRHMERLTSMTYSEQKAFINGLPQREGYSPWRMATGNDIWGNCEMGDGLVNAVQDTDHWQFRSMFIETGNNVVVPYSDPFPLIIACTPLGYSRVYECTFEYMLQHDLWQGRIDSESDSYKEVHTWILGQQYAACDIDNRIGVTVACDSPALDDYGYVLADNARDATVGAWVCATPVNRPPAFDPVQDQSVTEGETLEFSVYARDPDFMNTLTYSASNLPTGATFDPESRTFRWTPSYQQSGTYSILFNVTDNGKPSPLGASMAITITVDQGNCAPKLDIIGDKSVMPGTLLKFSVTATDVDPGDTLTFEAGNLPEGASFVCDREGQVFTWLPGADRDATVVQDILFKVTDNGIPRKSDYEYISVCVGNCSKPPKLVPIGNKQVREGEELEFWVIGTIPNGDTLTYLAQNLPPGASLDAVTGKFSWTPDWDQSGVYQNVVFTVRGKEYSGSPALSASETISITVGDVNRPPVLTPIGARWGYASGYLTILVNAQDPDGDTLSYSATGLPGMGEMFYPATGDLYWHISHYWGPTEDFYVTFTVTDNGSPPRSVSETVKITIHPWRGGLTQEQLGRNAVINLLDGVDPYHEPFLGGGEAVVVNPGETEHYYICSGVPINYIGGQDQPPPIHCLDNEWIGEQPHWWARQLVNPCTVTDCGNYASLSYSAMAFSVSYPGSEFLMEVYDPDGQLFASYQSTESPITAVIPRPAPGLWRFDVVALEVPYNYYPISFVAGATLITPPVALLNAPPSGLVGSSIQFDASASHGTHGSIVSYAWDWNGDGVYEETTVSPIATHVFGSAYIGMVGLKVNDTEGLSGDASVSIKITLPSDLNADGKIDCADLAVVKASFGKRTGQTGFNAVADVNKDGVVDVRDLATVSRQVPAGTICR